MTDVRIGVAGCAGRMGRALVHEIARAEGCVLAGGCEQAVHPALGQDIGVLAGLAKNDMVLGDDPGALFEASDVVLDFTSPAATMAHAGLAGETATALVSGTTGLGPQQMAALRDAGTRAAVVWAANMSVGINLLLALTRQVAAVLDERHDIEILDIHHRDKVDAPSGTAWALGEAAAKGRGRRLEDIAVTARDGHTGPRRPGDIGFAVLRGGTAAGDHRVLFAGDDERIELAHHTADRSIFAAGAVRAARWAATAGPGFHDIAEALGLTLPAGPER